MRRTCDLAPELLENYLDGELRGRQRRRLERHLTDCETCRDEVANERRLSAAFAKLPALPCPDAVTRRVLDATVRTSPEVTGRPDAVVLATGAREAVAGGRSPRRIAAGWSVGVAAAVLVTVLVGFGWRSRVDGPPVPTTAVAVDPGSTHAAAVTTPPRAALQTRQALAIMARAVVRTEEEAFTATFTEKLPRILRESLSLALDRNTGGRG